MARTDRSDRDILTAFFNATGGKNWKNRDNWASGRPLDDWHGVDADAAGRVTGIHLNDNGLTGRIPPDLGGLKALSWLNLANNRLDGPLPAQLGGLGRLKALYVNHNAGLAGELPLELSRLQLDHFAYDGTRLYMPNDAGFRRWLLSIEHRFVAGLSDREPLAMLYEAAGGENWKNKDNWLSGRPLDDWHGIDADAAGRVTGIHLNDNGLAGRIPQDLAGLSALSWLNLANNRLDGPLPAQLGGLGRLKALYVNHNAGLAGELPPELSRLRLDHFAYDGTRLYMPNDAGFRRWLLGIETRFVAGLSDREPLALLYEAAGGENWKNNDNWLSDRPLDEWHGIDADAAGRVTGIHLNDNGLTGQIPQDLAGLSALSWLNLANNRLAGPLPAQLGGLGRLKALYVNHNAGLAGELPPELSRLPLEHLAYDGTELRVPDDTAFRRWILGIENHYGKGMAREIGETGQRVTHEWFPVNLAADYGPRPAVVAGIQTFAGSDTAAVRIRNAGGRGFEVKVEEEQSLDREVRHLAESIGYVAGEGGLIYDDSNRAVGELGTVRIGQETRDHRERVHLWRSYTRPVVVATIGSYNGSHPSHIRVTECEAGADSFVMFIEEWAYLDGFHLAEDVGYLVVEAGRHRLRDRSEVEAGVVTADHNWAPVEFEHPFSGSPVVLSQCLTWRGSDPVVTRQRNVGAGGFEVRLQEEERKRRDHFFHMDETVGFVALK